MNQTAFFVSMPFSMEDLKRPHLAERRKPYIVEKTVMLAKIDYENFVTDLCVDRWFIEENKNLCYVDDDDVWHCILVRRRRETEGVLVMPEGQNFPKWAALSDCQ
jgi:hypothetical protein